MIEFKVEDMTCGHCASAITKAVKELDAQGRVDVDLHAKRVRVESPLDPEEVRAAIEEAGYTPVRQ